jgi:HEAT repeat protein
MKQRRALKLGCILLVPLLLGGAMFIPGSPVNVLEQMGYYGLYDGRAPRAWMRDLKSTDEETRRKACFALGAMGSDAEHAVPELARLMVEDPDGGVRVDASLALTKMVPASGAAVPELIEALQDKESLVRLNATLTLLRLRKEAQPAISALAVTMREERNDTNIGVFHFTIQEAAAMALGKASAGTDEAVEPLMAAFKSAETQEMRIAILRAFRDIGPQARKAIPLVEPLLTSKARDLREAAEDALKAMGAKIKAKQVSRSGPAPGEMELPEEHRKHIWEIEHHGNLLVRYGFGPLARALARGQAADLSRLLADDFQGTDLDGPVRVGSATAYAQVERLQGGKPSAPLAREAFTERLLAFRKVFGQRTPQVKLALMTLSPRQRGQLAGDWEGTAQLRLYGEHAPGAPAEVVVHLRYGLSQPSKESLSRPGWLRRADVLSVLTARAPRYLFKEVARQRGIDTSWLHNNWKMGNPITTPGGVYVCDFNRDGILDILVTDAAACALYQGCPDGTFKDVTDSCGLPRSIGRPQAAWIDIDGDGWDDLILAGRVYRNEGGRRFVDYTARCNLRMPGNAVNMVVADYDRDGKLDLYVTLAGRPGSNSWLEERSGEGRGNYLWRNKGNWQFEDVSKSSGADAGRCSTFSAAWLDANNDGWPDLHVINEFGNGVLLLNNRDGTFTRQALGDRPVDFGSMGVAVGDVNNDGHIDIYCANMYSKAGNRVVANLPPDAYPPPVMEKMRRFVAGSQLHLNRGGGKFEQVGAQMQVAAVGWAYGPCLADLDNDGFLDVFATAGYLSRSREEPDG